MSIRKTARRFAKKLGQEHWLDQLPERWVDQLPGGYADEEEPANFEPEALVAGVKTEMEHTHDPQLAMEIAMDHLEEDPKYYDMLEKMEREMGIID